MSETPTVGFVLNETHLEAASYLMDSTIAQRLQLEGNPLYDKDLTHRVRRAIKGASDSGDEGDHVGTEKARKGKKRKEADSSTSSNPNTKSQGCPTMVATTSRTSTRGYHAPADLFPAAMGMRASRPH